MPLRYSYDLSKDSGGSARVCARTTKNGGRWSRDGVSAEGFKYVGGSSARDGRSFREAEGLRKVEGMLRALVIRVSRLE